MAGYTPLFSTLTTGTLCGKWPDIGLWPIALSMADKHGVVDCTQAYIAGVTGLAVDEVTACMRRFCEPDPGSRSDEYSGARLVLLDDHRDWGWRVVNHGIYREKARKSAYDAERTESGKDAERKRVERAAHNNVSRDVPTSPAKSRAGPLSDSDSDSDSREDKRGAVAPRESSSRATRIPPDFALTAERRAFAISEARDPDRTFANFCDHWRAAPGAKARKADWDATWRKWCRSEYDRSTGVKPRAKTVAELEAEEAQRASTGSS